MDKAKIAYHVREIIKLLGENPEREGLRDTPERVARMYEEIFEGVQYTNDEIVEKFGVTFEEEDFFYEKNKDMVLVKDIEIFSTCEHHLALMYNMKVAIAYMPQDKVIGLSKIVRIADMVGRRLQLQERIGKDIAEIIGKVTGTEDVAVIIEGEHACMTTRGIKKNGSKTISTVLRGRFDTDKQLCDKLMTLYKA